MGEEEKKPEEKKVEEKDKAKAEEAKKDVVVVEEEKKKKKEESNEEAKEEKAPPPQPQPLQEIVLKVYMHCEGCARKVRRCLKGFQGVEDVVTDCKSHKVVVKGEKADPLKVLERVQRKSHRQVELLSPIPKPPSEDDKKPEEEEKDKPKPEDKKEETPVVTVVLKVFMHCEACAQEIKKRILRMKGVESAEPDLKSSLVTVKGALDPAKLVEYVYKRTSKHAVIVKQESDNKEEGKGGDENKKDEKKSGGDQEADNNNNNKPKSGSGGGGGEPNNSEENKKESDIKENVVVSEESKVVEMKRNEFNYYPQRYAMELHAYNAYAPQIFSDENPNACSVM